MAATYPNAIKIFTVFHDFSDVIWAYSVNEIHDEIVQIEQTLGLLDPPTTTGAPPLLHGTPYTSFAAAIQDLYLHKAPLAHTHLHSGLQYDNQGNDHPQYIQVTGYPGFSRPVPGQRATSASQLTTLGQVQGFGYQNAAQVRATVNAAVGDLMQGALGGAPVSGVAAASPAWVVKGGMWSGRTDGTGRAVVPISPGYSRMVQAWSCTKIPPQPPYGATPYNWVEAQVTLMSVSPSQAIVQFSHDYSWQENMWVSLTWIAIGI